MSPASHQTIELSKGKHTSPEDGACVLELASMLAGEPFSDHPASVCPVIGSFLRAYNDSIDDERRQDLYAYASDVVGTRRSLSVQRERAARLMEWAVQMRRRRWINRLVRTSRPHRRPSAHAVGAFAVRAIPKHTARTHAEALALLEELLELEERSRPARAPDPGHELPPTLYPVV